MATANDYPFVCPSCGSHDLRVSCEITCKVIQAGDGEFETEPADPAECWYFDRHSHMSCWGCGFDSEVRDFEIPYQPVKETKHD